MDDLICGAPTLYIAYQQIQAALMVGHLLGLEFKPSKIVWPDLKAVVIGLFVDLQKKLVDVKPGKREEILELIRKLISSSFWSVKDIQRIMGFLFGSPKSFLQYFLY